MQKNELVKSYILDKIHKKIYSPGQMIESEVQLCEKLQVSRMTIRKALDELAADGIIFKEKGRGTFISRQPKYAEFQCGIGFTQETRRRGMTASTKNATLVLSKANKIVAKQLNINLGALVWEVNRVRCADNQPVLYACEYYNYLQCEDLNIDIVNGSIYQHFESKGIAYAFADQKIEAISCPDIIAHYLEIPPASPVILMSLTVYMKNGIPFNFGYAYYRTDKFTLIQSVYNKEVY